MHSDLYKGIYRTPDEFLTDILRIQANAEVNKIMEQDAEAPIKAGQMVNHTKVMLDQTFDANFRSECSKMADRMREKEKDQPKKERKGKGRDLPGEGIVAAAKQAAIDGGLLKVRPLREQHNPETADDDVIIEEGSGENGHKRAREDGEGEGMEGLEGGDQDGQGPAKRMRAEGSVDLDSTVAAGLPDGQAVASTSYNSNGVNGYHPNGATSSRLNDLLNPTSASSLSTFQDSPAPDFTSSTVPGVTPAALAPPMAVGATPSLSPSKSLAKPDNSFLAGVPPASANPFVASTSAPVASSSIVPSPKGAAPRQPEETREGTPTPAAGDVAQPEEEVEPEKERSPTPMEATPPPLPDFILPSEAVDAFSSFLKNDTSSLNVDQLEQLRAACFDSVWRGKGDWDRTRLIEELDELAKEFVEEVESMY